MEVMKKQNALRWQLWPRDRLKVFKKTTQKWRRLDLVAEI
jgi:hypothetical protein